MSHQSNLEIMPTNGRKPERSFYIGWIVLSTLCTPIAYLLTIIILKIITDIVGDYVYVNGIPRITEDYLLMYVFIPIVSLLTGVLQYGMLSQFLPRMGWWVLATFAGWLLGVLVLALPEWMNWTNSPLNTTDLVLLIMGLTIGITQWFVLQHRLPQAGWWIIANTFGWVLLGWIIPGNGLDGFGLFLLGLLPACATAAMVAVIMSRVSPIEPAKM